MQRSKKNIEWVWLIVPFALWAFCFRHFFSQRLSLEADALSYFYQAWFYTDNLSKGVFPLWDPTWLNGVPYHFFLRRIGDSNPFFLLLTMLKWLGFSPLQRYLFFLAAYYFLAGLAFFLIVRLLVDDFLIAFIAYVLFLFSSWGSEIFYNYIVIIFVPIIWFFYFLIRFSLLQRRSWFLGMCFCAGLGLITYIPFIFLTILLVFALFYLVFYPKEALSFIRGIAGFLSKNKLFGLFCVFFLLASCIPGLIFYKESKSGQFVLPGRQAGAAAASAVTVNLESTASGDLISHGYFDRIFDDHAHLDLGDIYVPYVFFIILLMTLIAPVNKLIFFLLSNILAFCLITITSAAYVHKFLFDHLIIFKFIRQLYYFFWLVMLPMAFVLSAVAFKSLTGVIKASANKKGWLIFIIGCHLVFALFLLTRQGVLWGAWSACFLSLAFFLLYFSSRNPSILLFCMVLGAVFIQSAQVYDLIERSVHQVQTKRIESAHVIKAKYDLYYTTPWFNLINDNWDPDVLKAYIAHPFVLYDNVLPCTDTQNSIKAVGEAIGTQQDAAYVPRDEEDPAVWKTKGNPKAKADFNPVASGQLIILHADANTLTLESHLASSRFLVVNDNYTKDWHAFINGHSVPILRANVSFKGFWLPAGDTRIFLRFLTPLHYAFHLFMLVLYTGAFLYLMALFKERT